LQNKHRKDEDALLKKKADERELLRKKKQNMQKGSNPTLPPLETDESVAYEEKVPGNENISLNPKVGEVCQKCEGLVLDGCCQNCGKKVKIAKEEVELDERLGGKGYSRSAYKGSIHPPSRKSSGDWPDSDRGEGNKAKRRAGEKVKAKSPTYAAWVKNKNVKEGFKTQYGKKGKLSKTDAPGSRHDHTHDVDPKMADHVPNKKVRKSSKAETRANVLKFDMKKEETVNELNRYGKETGKATGSLNKRPGSPVATKNEPDSAVNTVRRMIRKDTGRPEGQQKKERGKKPPKAGEYGGRRSPADIILKRREDKKRAAASMMDTRGT